MRLTILWLKAYGASPYVVQHSDLRSRRWREAFEQYHDKFELRAGWNRFLQGAGGMRMLRYFIKRLGEGKGHSVINTGVLLEFLDEVATGFGRTGNRFVADRVASGYSGSRKGIGPAGYIGHLRRLVANKKVFDGFNDDNPEHALIATDRLSMGVLPSRAVQALASIELFENTEQT